MKSLSLVVPVHNGEDFIVQSIEEYYQVFAKKFKKLEIIVVCNACTDNTQTKCLNLKSKIPIKVINVERKGKGHALIAGFNLAQNEIIGFLDSDNPFELSKILEMPGYLKTYEIVIITKFRGGGLKAQKSLLRRFLSLGGAIFQKVFFNLDVKDTQAGAKFMKKEVWEKIDRNFVGKGFEFDIELLYKIKKAHGRIKEYYLLPKVAESSTVKIRILPGMIYRLLKLRICK